MGVMYDYFAAPSDEVAAATIDLPGPPGGPLPPPPMPLPELLARHGREGLRRFGRPKVRVSDSGVPALMTKGFDVTADLGLVHALLTGAGLDEEPARPLETVIAERDGGERLILEIAAEVRDALAAATREQLQHAAVAYVESTAGYRRFDLEGATDLLDQLAELARRARDGGHGLYCWICV